MAMASRYNSMPLPAEVLVAGAQARLIRRRESYDDLVAHETDPTELPVTAPQPPASAAPAAPRASAPSLPGAPR
jgi:hypothetical protein